MGRRHSCVRRPHGGERNFEPVPEDEFTATRLLGDDPVRHIATAPEPVQVSALLTWYPLPIALGTVSLAAGAVMATLARKIRGGL